MTDRKLIEEIKSKLDIVEIIRPHVQNLKKTGRNYFGLCPFHSEKNPSFSINEELQRYKCFGCGESGDVINFVQKVENIDFPKALEICAEKAGIDPSRLKIHDPKTTQAQQLQKRLLEANRLSAEYFHHLLTKHQIAKDARAYVSKREIPTEQVKQFLIGYAPSGFENLKSFLLKRGYTPKELVEFGLLVEKNNKIYDKFRNRLMFPILDHLGDIVGFSGRILDPNDIPKYLNTSQTQAYKKSDVVYGLFQAKDAIRKQKYVIMVEGNVDVPMAHKVGIQNVVAPMGTALTAQQLKLLKRYADEIWFAFDSDEAGQKALERAYILAQEVSIPAKAINLAPYQDLDEAIRTNLDELKKRLQDPKPIITHIRDTLAKTLNISIPEQKREIATRLTHLLQNTRDEIDTNYYVGEIATFLDMNENTLRQQIAQKPRTSYSPHESTPSTARSIPTETQTIGSSKETYAISFLIHYPQLRNEDIPWQDFISPSLHDLYTKLIANEDLTTSVQNLDQNEQKIAEMIIMQNIGEFQSDSELIHFFKELVGEIKQNALRQKIRKLKYQIRTLEITEQDTSQLINQLSDLNKQLKQTLTKS